MKKMYYVELSVEEMDFFYRLLSKELRIRENSLKEEKEKYPQDKFNLYPKRDKEIDFLRNFTEGYELF